MIAVSKLRSVSHIDIDIYDHSISKARGHNPWHYSFSAREIVTEARGLHHLQIQHGILGNARN